MAVDHPLSIINRFTNYKLSLIVGMILIGFGTAGNRSVYKK